MEHPFIAHYGAMTDKPETDFQPDTSLPFPELDLLRLFRLAHIYYKDTPEQTQKTPIVRLPLSVSVKEILMD